jgi:RES domain-containing protein
MVYTSSTLALAALEVFVHVSPADAPPDLVAVHADIPGDVRISRVRVGELPPGWRGYPAPAALADRGTEWVRRGQTAVMEVPSAVIPPESNFLLNPHHADFRRLRLGRATPFHFDQRMWKGR